MMDTQVVIKHPDVDEPYICTMRQYEVVWKDKGWELVSTHEVPVDEDAPKPSDTLEDWQNFARENGLSDEAIDGKTKKEIAALLGLSE